MARQILMDEITCEECKSVYKIKLKERTKAKWNTNARYIFCPICGELTSPFIYELNSGLKEVPDKYLTYINETEKWNHKKNIIAFLAYWFKYNKIKYEIWKDKLIMDKEIPYGFNIETYLFGNKRVVYSGGDTDDFFQSRAKGEKNE